VSAGTSRQPLTMAQAHAPLYTSVSAILFRRLHSPGLRAPTESGLIAIRLVCFAPPLDRSWSLTQKAPCMTKKSQACVIYARKPCKARTRQCWTPAARTWLLQRSHHVTWCIGHLCRGARPEKPTASRQHCPSKHLPILPERCRIEVKAKTAAHSNREAGSSPSRRAVSHRCDREGEMIAREDHRSVRLPWPDPEALAVGRFNDASSATLTQLQAGAENAATCIFSARPVRAPDWLIAWNLSRLFTPAGSARPGYQGVPGFPRSLQTRH